MPRVILIALIFVAIVNLINYVVDPHDLNHKFNISGFNEIKPKVTNFIIDHKISRIVELKPKTIIVGNSRVFWGFDPLSHTFNRENKPIYNSSTFSNSIMEINDLVKYINNFSKLDTVYVGVDLFLFNSYSQYHMKNVNRHFIYNDIEMLKSSFETILNSFPYNDYNFYGNGNEFYKKNITLYKLGGYHNAFKQIEFGTVNNRKYRPNPYQKYSFQNDKKTSTLEIYRDLVDFCFKNKINLKVFINPVHARHMEIIYQTGLIDYQFNMINSIYKITNSVSNGSFKVYNFFLYNEVTMETPQLLSQMEETNFWYESSHYKPNVGDIIIQKINGDGASNNFSVLLNENNSQVTYLRNNFFINREKFIKNNWNDYKEIVDLFNR